MKKLLFFLLLPALAFAQFGHGTANAIKVVNDTTGVNKAVGKFYLSRADTVLYQGMGTYLEALAIRDSVLSLAAISDSTYFILDDADTVKTKAARDLKIPGLLVTGASKFEGAVTVRNDLTMAATVSPKLTTDSLRVKTGITTDGGIRAKTLSQFGATATPMVITAAGDVGIGTATIDAGANLQIGVGTNDNVAYYLKIKGEGDTDVGQITDRELIIGLTTQSNGLHAHWKFETDEPTTSGYLFNGAKYYLGTTAGVTFYVTEDIATGNAFTFEQSAVNRELTSSNSKQAFMYLGGEVAQSATAAFDALHIDPDVTSLGSGATGAGNNLLRVGKDGTTTYAVITTSGLLGLGTTVPQAQLSVVGVDGTGTGIHLVSSDVNKRRDSWAQATDTSSVALRIDSAGNPRIDYAAADGDSARIHVRGDSTEIYSKNAIVLDAPAVLIGASNVGVSKIDTVFTAGYVPRWVKFTSGGKSWYSPVYADTTGKW